MNLFHNAYILFILPLKAADANSGNCNVKQCYLPWKLNVIEVFLDIYLDIFQHWLEFIQMKTSRPEEVKFKRTQLVIKSRTLHAGLMLAHTDFIFEMHFYCSVSHYISV